jgi:hypothetical protein
VCGNAGERQRPDEPCFDEAEAAGRERDQREQPGSGVGEADERGPRLGADGAKSAKEGAEVAAVDLSGRRLYGTFTARTPG